MDASVLYVSVLPQLNTFVMKHKLSNLNKVFIAFTVFFTIAIYSRAQLNPFWGVNGNATSNGNFIGTTNNEPLIFKTNSLEALRIKPNGEIKISSFENMGKGVVTFNNNGVLTNRVFPNDTNQVFCGSGNFKSIATLSGWTRTGNVLYNAPGVNVGIGINNPQYALDVVGSAHFTGTVSAQGVILTNKLLADTMKAAQMLSLNNNMHLSAGGINQIYTSTGDLRIQSNATVNASHVIIAAGTNGNVGVGTFSPAYKFDVNGQMRVTDKILVNRLVPLPGDSLVHIGDSSITFNTIANIIGATASVPGGNRGLGVGWGMIAARGTQSLALGTHVQTSLTAPYAIVIGSGFSSATPLVNSISKSLMIGFNSNIPTVFVGPAVGMGTIGKVGIGTTTPDALFQVGTGADGITLFQSDNDGQGSMSTLGFNVHLDAATGLYTTRGNGTTNAGSAIIQDEAGALRFYVFENTGGADQSTLPVHVKNEAVMILHKERVQIGQAVVSSSSIFNTPDTKLTVDGRILCKDLVVSDVDWQDEVFDSTYVLMPIDSVSSFISTNGHLPGVKPQAEIEQNGMSLSETVTMQQRKIEELTLYIIQLDARMKELEEEKKQQEQQPK